MDPSPQIHVEGPPPGMAAGKYDVPRWSIALFGGAILVASCLYLGLRVARGRRA